MYCLPEELVNEFIKRLKSGEIPAEKLSEMTSDERHQLFANSMGEVNAKSINALFESKLLLKNQQLGIINWIKQLTGLKKPVLNDMLSKVNRMTEVLQPKELSLFLNDLANQRLGVDVTFEEAGKISELAKKVADTRSKVPDDSPKGSPERIEYGTALAVFKDYVGKLKLEATDIVGKELLKHPVEIVKKAGGLFKSMLSTLDDSFFGRQGIKAFFISSSTWGRNLALSFKDIGKELKGVDGMTAVKADVWSRPYAMDGTYGKMGLDIGIKGEEAFPSSLPERIPVFGRIFKAAETAFNGGALRMRGDLADRIIDLAKLQEIDIKDKKWAQDAGDQVNSITGRGSIGKYLTPEGQKTINNVMFSVKFVKSQFDVLLDPFNVNLDPFVRKQAATNLVKIITGITAINLLSSMLQKDGAQFDPRTTNFMRPRIPGTNAHVDISGGLTSIITLASRVLWSKHDGEWGHWSQSSSGNWTKLNAGSFGQQTGWDVLIDGLFSNKLSPLFGLMRDELRGQNFNGDKVTLKNSLTGLLEPLPISTAQQIKNSPDKGKILWLMLLEELGFNTSVKSTASTNWNNSTGAELLQFKTKFGQKTFDAANKEYNQRVNDWMTQINNDSKFKSLSDADRQKVITKKKDEIKIKIFREYHFNYVAPRKKILPKF